MVRVGLTDAEHYTKDLIAYTSKEQMSSIVNAIRLPVTVLEGTDNVRGPPREEGNEAQEDDTGNQAQDVEGSWDCQDAQSNLGLHHQGNRAKPADL